MDSLINASKNKEKLGNIDGLGPKAISSLQEYFSNSENINSIKNLQNILTISNYIKLQKIIILRIKI